MSLKLAATHPERVSHLVLYGTYASLQGSPWTVRRDDFEKFLAHLEAHWGEGVLVRFNAPGRMGDDAFVRWFGRLERAVASPSAILALMRANYEADVAHLPASIRVPTLVLHREGDALVPVEAGRQLARSIRGARYVELPGDDHMLQALDQDVLDRLLDEIEEFVTGRRPRRRSRPMPAAAASTDAIGELGEAIARLETAIAAYRSRGEHAGTNGGNGASSPPARASHDGSAPREMFLREGEYWTMSWQDNVVRVKDARGLHCIAHLLANPGRHVLARDLAAAGAAPVDRSTSMDAGGTATDLGDAGALLDARAREEYRRRIGELQEELADAIGCNDAGRADHLRAELECLRDQIVAAVGLGGRERRAAAHAERARLMVTKAIKTAIAKIRASDASLGRHLATSIRTGNYCAYDPGPPPCVSWRL
jgi:hypothetical protein